MENTIPRFLLGALCIFPNQLEGLMAQYILNRNPQPTGEHEVHKVGCTFMPKPENRIPLGEHLNCYGAVQEAKKHARNVDGCKFCSPDCHTR